MGKGLAHVAASQVGEEAVKVAGLLDTVPKARELVGEVLAASIGGVEVRLDGHPNATPHDAVSVPAAQAGLHARDALVRHALQQTHIKTELVPLDGGAGDADKGERDAGLPVLRRLCEQKRVA